MSRDDRPIGYWDELESNCPLRGLLAEAAGEQWTLRGGVVTGQEDETLFSLVLRHRVGDSGLILRIGYCAVDLDNPEDPVRWSENYLDMRVQGALPQALSQLFQDGSMGQTESPPMMDSRDPELREDPELPELESSENDRETTESSENSTSTEASGLDPKTSVTGSTPDTVRCDQCGNQVARENAVNFGSEAIAADAWIHEGNCPDNND
jgi:hypothetical protein